MKARGFSLIETIIYIAIFAAISVLVIEIVIITTGAFGKARVKRSVTLEGQGAMERMIREIRLANSVDAGGSVFATNPGHVVLNTVVSSSDSTPTVREFLISGNDLILREGSTDTSLISGASTTNLIFRHVTSQTLSEAVKIELTIEDGVGNSAMSANFYSTVILRGSY